jgi:uncharacterized Zn finger protein
MIKVGDRLTIDGELVEVTYVMNDSCYSYKSVKEVKEAKKEEIKEVQPEKLDEALVEAPRRRRRKV